MTLTHGAAVVNELGVADAERVIVAGHVDFEQHLHPAHAGVLDNRLDIGSVVPEGVIREKNSEKRGKKGKPRDKTITKKDAPPRIGTKACCVGIVPRGRSPEPT